tara:strand:+ start:209 stop:595 length:387 start_codon:yes stop_codon:yes gene_type:complete
MRTVDTDGNVLTDEVDDPFSGAMCDLMQLLGCIDGTTITLQRTDDAHENALATGEADWVLVTDAEENCHVWHGGELLASVVWWARGSWSARATIHYCNGLILVCTGNNVGARDDHDSWVINPLPKVTK